MSSLKATRIAFSKPLNPGKFAQLTEQARRLGVIRSEVWHRYGSIAGVTLKDRQIRDAWLAEGRQFDVQANPWKETLRDAKADISMTVEAAKVKARQAIRRHTKDEAERKRLYTLLKSNEFASDRYLSRIMRKYWTCGHNHMHNQIIVRADNYRTWQQGGQAWVSIPGLEPRKKVCIPLSTTVEPTGTLRVILRRGKVEIHYTIDAEETNDCGGEIVGVDKGYSEVLVASDGDHHGDALGGILRAESDYLKVKHQRRNKLRALAKNTSDERKRQRIISNNLGSKKLQARAAKVQANIRTVVFEAVHAVVDKASAVAAEDLTAPMSGKKFGKNMNRRLSSWTKGVIAEALESVCQRRGSSLHLINPAYTSQMDSRNGLLLGKRVGDSFHCFDGVVLQADENAARNVRARLFDPDIDRWTPYQKVKSILLERTQRHRLGLLNPDTSCMVQAISTVSEIPNAQLCTTF